LFRRKPRGPTLVVYGLIETLAFAEVRQACQRILDASRPQLTHAWIDGFSDFQDLPEKAGEAKQALEEMAVLRHEKWLRPGVWTPPFSD
jgi:hypothetical protein